MTITIWFCVLETNRNHILFKHVSNMSVHSLVGVCALLTRTYAAAEELV